jgi:AhpD family alkylhydroperoxidase
MAVVTPLPEDQAPLLAKPFYAGGDPGPITAALAHVPELLEVALPFLGAILSPSSIEFRTKEIVILRTSALLACRYCIDSHTPVALDSGLASEQVRALRNEEGFDTSERFTDHRDRALIAWNDAVAGKTGAVPTAIGAEMSRNFEEHEIVELTLLIGATMLLNRFATSLELPVGDSTIARLSADGFERAA